jgi:hypothetical protein
MALPIDAEYEKSICTGSVYYHGGLYHAFYATRLGDWRQVLSRAASEDGIHFAKQQPNPFAAPPQGYDPLHFRDPVIFADEGGDGYHMLVTSMLEQPALDGYGGCLAHLHSPDLQEWRMCDPFLVPGFDDAPECSDYFHWNGWYYLLFSNHLTTRYRMSRQPFGPWLRPPADVLDSNLSSVMKTAAFGSERRIGVSWLGTRTGDCDDGRPQWGGNLLFREIIQHADGALGVKFPPEMTPTHAPPQRLPLQPVTANATIQDSSAHLHGEDGMEAVVIGGLPHDFRIHVDVTPEPHAGAFGLRLRAQDFAHGYQLRLQVPERIVRLHNEAICAVEGLDQPLHLEIAACGDILDVCIDGRRCIANRLPEQHGDKLYLFAHNANAVFSNLQIEPLLA